MIGKKYENLQTYISSLFHRKTEWALCYRRDLVTRGQNTNNISEAAMKVMKDNVLNRMKACSPVHLFNICITEYIEYYTDKLLSIINGTIPAYIQRRAKLFHNKMLNLVLEKKDEENGVFQVLNTGNGNRSTVHINLGLCSCYIGMNGAICKHTTFVSQVMKIVHHPLVSPSNEQEKKTIFFIATGRVDVQEEWFANLEFREENKNSCIAPHNDTARNVVTEERAVIIEESSHPTVAEELRNQIKCFNRDFVDDFIAKAESSPRILEAMSVLIKNYKLCKTDEKIFSACSNFGKFSGLHKKNKVVTSKRIGVSAQSVARRKSSLATRRCVQSGRPTRESYTQEHGYNKTTDRKSKIPHSLSYRIMHGKR